MRSSSACWRVGGVRLSLTWQVFEGAVALILITMDGHRIGSTEPAWRDSDSGWLQRTGCFKLGAHDQIVEQSSLDMTAGDEMSAARQL